jgi:hypothetical protein
MSPFVLAYIGSKEMYVTVGNESYPTRRNTAVIKSMEYGYIDKPQVRLEILDEAGSELGLLVDSLKRCGKFGAGSKRTMTGTEMLIKFGWVKSNCQETAEKDYISFDGFIRTFIIHIDVSFSGGMTKYTIEGHPVDVITTNQREATSYGPDMTLVDAIKRICASKGIVPIFAQVEEDGSVTARLDDVPWEWEKVSKPRGSWRGNNNDVLSTISRWVSPFRIKSGTEGAGITLCFDSKDYDGPEDDFRETKREGVSRLWLWKDPRTTKQCPSRFVKSEDNQRLDGGSLGLAGQVRGSIGTFIVNGGKCSPVIKFEPKFNYMSGLARFNTGGNAGTSGEAPVVNKDVEKEDFSCEEDRSAGPENKTSQEQSASQNYSPTEAVSENAKSNMAHVKANMMSEFTIAALQGELTLMGMPNELFVNHRLFLFSPCSIVVLNPFFIANEAGSDPKCGDWSWLAKSGCNEVLSDSNYICCGVNHSIKEGQYTTTLKVYNSHKTKVEIE